MEEPKLINVPDLSPYDDETPQTNLFHNQYNSTEIIDNEYNITQRNIITKYYGYIFCFILFFGIVAVIIYEYTNNQNYPV